MGFFPPVVIFRIEKDPAYRQLRNDEFFACGQNKTTGTQERVKNGRKSTARSGNFLTAVPRELSRRLALEERLGRLAWPVVSFE